MDKMPEQLDVKLPGGGSLFGALLGYARGALDQRPDHFDPNTNTWTDAGKAKMREVYAVGATEQEFNQILERVENNLKRERLPKQERKNITKEEFERKGKEWTALDTEYDNLFQDFLNNPHVKTPEEVARFRAMQKRLYAIEEELYPVAEGKVIIQG